MKQFTNENRNRYYGLRIGDIVSCREASLKQFVGQGTVIYYGFLDNNSVTVKVDETQKEVKCVPEWLTLETKVEDRVFTKENIVQLPLSVLEATYGQRRLCNALTTTEIKTNSAIPCFIISDGGGS